MSTGAHNPKSESLKGIRHCRSEFADRRTYQRSRRYATRLVCLSCSWDLALYGRLLGALGPAASIIASAGIATLRDLDAVRAIGCSGAIVGRALYDGTLDLAEAIRATS